MAMFLWQNGETGIMCWSEKQPSSRHSMVPTMFEDELPEMSDEEYRWWYENSYVDVVRMGPKIEVKGDIMTKIIFGDKEYEVDPHVSALLHAVSEERDELKEKSIVLEKICNDLQEFVIWMTGCGYDFCQHKYFIKERDRLLKSRDDTDKVVDRGVKRPIKIVVTCSRCGREKVLFRNNFNDIGSMMICNGWKKTEVGVWVCKKCVSDIEKFEKKQWDEKMKFMKNNLYSIPVEK